MPQTLKITMLGSFSLTQGDGYIDDSNNRMRKVWLLLAYLIYTRNSRNTQENYLSLMQSTGGESDDPTGRLKALFYRVRTMLDQLGDQAGHQLIVRKNSTYAWNSEIPVELDIDIFDSLVSLAASQSGDQRLGTLLQALSLYQGDFLPKLSMESWVMPINAYYHQRFLDIVSEAISGLIERQRWIDATQLCHKALQIEPYSEELYQYLMRCQIATEDRSGAVTSYETMSELLFDTFGVMPSEESRKLYREATRERSGHTVPTEAVRDHLQELNATKGAMYCEYDFFKLLYQVQARSILRSGDVIHIALFSIHGEGKQSLPRRSLDTAMDNLQQLLIRSLRQGDVLTRCSASQIIVMLPQANYENSCAVCQRVCKAFYRQYPHTPATLHYSVHPLEPSVPGHQGRDSI